MSSRRQGGQSSYAMPNPRFTLYVSRASIRKRCGAPWGVGTQPCTAQVEEASHPAQPLGRGGGDHRTAIAAGSSPPPFSAPHSLPQAL
jgi:hypothetical protein